MTPDDDRGTPDFPNPKSPSPFDPDLDECRTCQEIGFLAGFLGLRTTVVLFENGSRHIIAVNP